MSEDLQELVETLSLKLPDMIEASDISSVGELTIEVEVANLLQVIEVLRTNSSMRFSTLIDITAVDYPSRAKRFDVVYHFLSMYTNMRIRVKAAIKDGDMVPSISETHKAANWFEREVFDMYGIMFSDHPDLRRILTDYGFRGYPLRKDFPTTGYTEVRYDEAEKRVVYEPVSLVQEYRQFDFMSPWEGAEYILPGDEKEEGAK